MRNIKINTNFNYFLFKIYKMTKWLDVVKKHAKLNPGKSMKEYLPHAKAEWDQLKKSGQVVVASASKAVKSVKIGGKHKGNKSEANDLSSVSQEQGQVAALIASSVVPLARGRGRGKSRTRTGGKGKKRATRTRRTSRKGRKSSKSKRKTGKRKGKKSSSLIDMTSINLK